MRLTVNTTGKTFTAAKAPEPKLQDGSQRTDKESGLPLWQVQLLVVDSDGGDVVSVTVAGEKPAVAPLDVVVVEDLVAIPWAATDNGKLRHGVSFRAARVYC